MNVRRLVLVGLFLACVAATPCLYARAVPNGPAGQDEALAACTPDDATLCLNSSRFQVHTQWVSSDGRTGSGHAVVLTGDTGYFWFFSANNVEMIVKVLDGRAINSNFWVFAGGLTNVKVIITVTDTQTGSVKVYLNPQTTAFQPIQDTGPFASPPAFDLTSTWSGPGTDDDGPTTVTWNLTQSGGSITGQFTAQEAPPRASVYRGTIAGTLSGTSLTYTVLIPKGSIAGLPNCSVSMLGSAVASEKAIEANYAGESCSGPFANGLLSLTKQ
jgi:hypothetical protein